MAKPRLPKLKVLKYMPYKKNNILLRAGGGQTSTMLMIDITEAKFTGICPITSNTYRIIDHVQHLLYVRFNKTAHKLNLKTLYDGENLEDIQDDIVAIIKYQDALKEYNETLTQ